MTPGPHGAGIGSFACAFGDLERRPEDIAGFAELWRERSPDAEFSAMGSGTFRTMTGPVEEYVIDCVKRVLGDQAVPAADVDHVVFATSDACLGRLGRDFAVSVLTALGMTAAVPVILSFQQCCSSLAALRYGWDLLRDDHVRNVVLVSVDFTPDDTERIRPFALFSDAVAGCLISRTAGGRLRLVSSALGVDHAGLIGRDSFLSRQHVARTSIGTVLGETGKELDRVGKVFPTNLYRPLTLFNAMAAGIPAAQLHFTEPARAYGHCGNSDWMINLMDYAGRNGLAQGGLYLALASAPGFFGCALLEHP